MHLMVTNWNEPKEPRLLELAECLERNLAHPKVTRIVVFIEEPMGRYRETLAQGASEGIQRIAKAMKHSKATTTALGWRVRHVDFIEYATRYFPGKDVGYINADIYFDDTFSLIAETDLTGLFVCLSKYNGARLHNPSWSQDAWFFRAPLPQFKADFKFGVLGNDNRIAFEAHRRGLKVVNPSLSVIAHHLHRSGVRRRTDAERYQGNYKTVPPQKADCLKHT